MIFQSRLKDFQVGKDSFTCNKCIKHVDIETLSTQNIQTEKSTEAVDRNIEQTLAIEYIPCQNGEEESTAETSESYLRNED